MNEQNRSDILVVDDKTENLRLLSGILKERGHTVRFLRKGHMVRDSVRKSPPEIILLDIMLPDMDGYEVCRQLKADERTRGIPVIFISAMNESADKVKAFSVGGVDYITKPFQEEEVLARVKTHLNLCRMQKRLETQNVQLTREIETRKQTEANIEKSKAFLNKVINAMPNPVFVKDELHRWIILNDAYCEFMGYEREELIGKTDRDFFPKEEADMFWEKDNLVFESGKTNTNEEAFTDSVGKPHIILTRKSVMVNEIGEKILVGIITDITRQKQAEDKLRRQNEYLTSLHRLSLNLLSQPDMAPLLQHILEGASDIANVSDGFIYLYDTERHDLELRFAIGLLADFVGLRLKPGEGLAGKVFQSGQPMRIDDYSTWEGRVAISEWEKTRAAVGIPLKSRNQVRGVIGMSHRLDGKTFGPEQISVLELFANIASVLLDNTRLYDSMKQDIAERRKTEQKLKHAKIEAESANRAKSAFLATTSHEIRTPMNSVLGFLELTLDDPGLSEFHRNNIAIAFRSANALLRLINDILDVSKLESGKLELDERPFHLPVLIRETLDILDIRAREKGLDLFLDIHPDVSEFYFGDPMRLRQIILNLVGNAIKFTENGGIKVTVAPLEKAGFLHFVVSDTGIGIPGDRLEKIFEPFVQADNSTVRRFGGTGLGTTISKKMVELMGGQIWAESEEGRGSVFHFMVRIPTTEQKPESPPQETPMTVILSPVAGFGFCWPRTLRTISPW